MSEFYPLRSATSQNGASMVPGRGITSDDVPACRGFWLEEVRQKGSRCYDLHTRLSWVNHGNLRYNVTCPHCGRTMDVIGRKDRGEVIGRFTCSRCDSGRHTSRACVRSRYMG